MNKTTIAKSILFTCLGAFFCLFLNVSATLAGITNIREIKNETKFYLVVSKLDGSKQQNTENIPLDGVYSQDFWIPCANNANECRDHYMTISVNNQIIKTVLGLTAVRSNQSKNIRDKELKK